MLTGLYLRLIAGEALQAAEKPPLIDEELQAVQPYDPQRVRQRELIVHTSTEQVSVVELDKALQLKKLRYTLCCTVCTLVGIVLALWGMSQTVIFEKFQPNDTLFGCSFLLFIPLGVCLRVFLCPGREEYERRQYIVERRNWRRQVSATRYKVYMGWDKEEAAERERELLREEEERKKRLAFAIKVGKNKPKLGFVDREQMRREHIDESPNKGRNVVIARTSLEYVKPPAILPDEVVRLETVSQLPNYKKNRLNAYAFVHPDPQGERETVERMRDYPTSSSKKSSSKEYNNT